MRPFHQSSRLLIPGAGLAFFAGFALLHAIDPALYSRTLTWWGIKPYHIPFFDIDAVASAIECARRGIDVYLSNPCDELGRRWYSPIWLVAAAMPVTRSWTVPIGFGLDLLFLASLAALPRPRSRIQMVLTLAAVLSPMTLYAVERANIDLLVFMLILAAGLVLSLPGRKHLIAYGLVLAAGLLKFYPFVAMGAALRENRRVLLSLAAASLAVVALFAGIFHRELPEALASIPKGAYFTDSFGAAALPNGLIELADILQTQKAHLLAVGLFALLTLAALATANRLLRRPGLQGAFVALREPERNLLVLGGLLIVGCFFAGLSVYYRGIFFILTLPGLMALALTAESTQTRRNLRRVVVLVLFLMWSEWLHNVLLIAARHETSGVSLWQTLLIVFWLGRELVWWWVIGSFCGLLLCFIAQPRLWRATSK